MNDELKERLDAILPLLAATEAVCARAEGLRLAPELLQTVQLASKFSDEQITTGKVECVIITRFQSATKPRRETESCLQRLDNAFPLLSSPSFPQKETFLPRKVKKTINSIMSNSH